MGKLIDDAELIRDETGLAKNTAYRVGSWMVDVATSVEQISGSVNSITGSLFGTASVAVNAQTASFLAIGTYSITSSWAQSASNAVNAQTASFLSGAFLQGGNSFGATALLGTNDDQNLQFETSGSVRVHIGNTGNVGIGTSTPAASLHISGALSGSILEPTSSGTPTFTGIDGQFMFGNSDGNHFIYVYMAGKWRSGSLSN